MEVKVKEKTEAKKEKSYLKFIDAIIKVDDEVTKITSSSEISVTKLRIIKAINSIKTDENEINFLNWSISVYAEALSDFKVYVNIMNSMKGLKNMSDDEIVKAEIAYFKDVMKLACGQMLERANSIINEEGFNN